MKKLLIVIVLTALLAVNIGANLNTRVVAIHPVEFFAAVSEDMPEGLDIFQNFTDFYNDGEVATLGERILWLGQTSFDALAFPVTGSIWFFRALAAFWGNFDVLFEFSQSSGGGEHGDLDDPNHAGGR